MKFQILLDLRLPLPSAGSLIGNFTRPLPFAITFDISAEYSVEMSLSSKCWYSEKPMTSRIEIHPTVHLIPAHIAHHVVDMQQPDGTRQVIISLGDESRQEKRPW